MTGDKKRNKIIFVTSICVVCCGLIFGTVAWNSFGDKTKDSKERRDETPLKKKEIEDGSFVKTVNEPLNNVDQEKSHKSGLEGGLNVEKTNPASPLSSQPSNLVEAETPSTLLLGIGRDKSVKEAGSAPPKRQKLAGLPREVPLSTEPQGDRSVSDTTGGQDGDGQSCLVAEEPQPEGASTEGPTVTSDTTVQQGSNIAKFTSLLTTKWIVLSGLGLLIIGGVYIYGVPMFSNMKIFTWAINS